MSMTEWAKREVEIACEREKPDRKEGEWDYGCACYESALKAFNSLMEDGHSGMSICFTKQILNRLIDAKPLTPIEDTPDIWNDRSRWGDTDAGKKEYQCKRMSSLFKTEYEDGTVEYHDIGRFSCVNIDNPNVSYHNGFVIRMMEKIFPIVMPYIPEDKPYRVYREEILTDQKNGDYDTMAILYVIKPDGEKVEINRYFKESETGFTEIDEEEWSKRCELHNERLNTTEKGE